MGDHLPPFRPSELAWDREGLRALRDGPRIQVGTPHQFRWLRGIVVSILLLNLADAVFTLHWIGTGQATEANPILYTLAHHHPGWFVVVKLSLVGLGSWLLLRLRHHALSVMAIFTAFMAYYLVFLYHLQAAEVQLLAFLAR